MGIVHCPEVCGKSLLLLGPWFHVLLTRMSFAFVPSAVRKKQPVLVSSRTPSASISVGAQVTSESTDNSRETKVLTIILSS